MCDTVPTLWNQKSSAVSTGSFSARPTADAELFVGCVVAQYVDGQDVTSTDPCAATNAVGEFGQYGYGQEKYSDNYFFHLYVLPELDRFMLLATDASNGGIFIA